MFYIMLIVILLLLLSYVIIQNAENNYKDITNEAPETIDFRAAGCIFADKQYVLGGFTPAIHTIFGLGGSREGKETYWETAVREVYEEIFEPVDLPKYLISETKEKLKPRAVLLHKGYVMILCDLKDLSVFYAGAKKANLKSRVYESIPTTLEEMVVMRSDKVAAEISEFNLIPMKKDTSDYPRINSKYVRDIARVYDILHERN